MTQNQQILLIIVLAAVMVGLFLFSAKQKRAHEEKMEKIRAERKANLEKLKRSQSN